MESEAYEDPLQTLGSVQSILLFPETQVSIRIPGRRADPVLKSSHEIGCYRKSRKGRVQSMMETIKQCKEPAIKGEAKQCVTSLESMVDFARYKLGNHVKALATEVNKETVKQRYDIAPAVHKLSSTKSVACHSENYVYYSHETSDTSTYLVPLVGEDKTRVDAVAVCHKDMSQCYLILYFFSMARNLTFFSIAVLAAVVSICHAAIAPEDYWNFVLSNMPMPNSIR